MRSEPPLKTPKRRWLADGIAGFSVALVLIPQSLAYADLAGMPPHTGLYAAALAPLLAAYFGSSPYLQTGPGALTSLLTFAALTTLAVPASAEYVALAAVLAVIVGVLRIIIGALKGGPVSYLMSEPVLRGFTTAAAILILSSQLPKALGVQASGEGVLNRAANALSDPSTWETTSLVLAGGTIAIMRIGRRLHPLFPGVLIAVAAGLAYSMTTGYAGPRVGDIPAMLVPPISFDLPWSRLPELLIPGGIIALVGFAEVASISQVFAEQKRQPWDPNREFVGQGVANLAAGFAGGFPVGGSFSRSAVNKMSGAQSRWSGAVAGATVLLFLPFARILEALPLAILGGIIIGAVIKLLNPRPLLGIVRHSKPQAFVGFSTFVLTLWLAPHVEGAVLLGIAVALAVHIWREQQFGVEARIEDTTLILVPQGVIWFGSAPMFRQSMVKELAADPSTQRVVIDLSHVGRIDFTGALALRDVVESGRSVGRPVLFDGVPPHARRIIGRVFPAELLTKSRASQESE
ncbi:MAG: solute carrier family 23 protein [Myxococcota bacterium]